MPKGMAIFLGGKGKPDESDDYNEDSEDSSSLGSMAKEKAARRIIDALKDEDAEALSSALERHYEACQE